VARVRRVAHWNVLDASVDEQPMSGRVWWWASGTAFLIAVSGLGAFVALGGQGRLDTGDKFASIGSLLIGLASLVVALVSLRVATRQVPLDPAVLLERAAEDLARLVGQQWQREATTRGLLHPEPLRVQWSSTGRPVAAPAAEVMDPMPGSLPTRLRLRGDVRTVADTWRKLPARQLVILGAPGAGKTSLAVLLVRQLLHQRVPGDPVPVLLNLAGWAPENVHLDTWLARRLAADYPQLTGRHAYGADAAVRLVDQGRVIPVLDGLDEMPEHARPLAVAALTVAVSRDRPLVLTCRANEYEATIAATGTPLARAAVVELSPVTGPEIAAYLIAGQVDGARRWNAVTTRLRAEPDGALARTLSTPLMVYLARTAYTPPTTDPGGLLVHADAGDVEQHLLAAYLPTMYRPQSRGSGNTLAPGYSADQAHHWLAYLARQLTRYDTRNLNLWSLKWLKVHALRLWTATAVASLTVAALIVPPMAFPPDMPASARAGEMIGAIALIIAMAPGMQILTSVFRSAIEEVRPFRIRIRIRPWQVVLGALVGLLVGFASGYMTEFLVDAWRTTNLGNSLWEAAIDYYRHAAPAGLPLSLAIGVIGAVCLAVANSHASPPTDVEVLGPVSALRRDRRALFAVCLVPMTAGGVLFGALLLNLFAVLGGLMLGMVFGVTVAIFLGMGRAWTRWQVLRCWLRLRGVAPWRLLEFLDDAHQRGVLRVVGMEYQFRHARLQDHLS
jgi:hypothetical protein